MSDTSTPAPMDLPQALQFADDRKDSTIPKDVALNTLAAEVRRLREDAARTPAHDRQALAEIKGTILDNMLNAEQKLTFVAAILRGELANPPKLGGYNE